jgi:2-polyprenyl-3-methyl-5-hydroxy-6-metoxy-1,4-benzoquinol methylase
VRSDISTQQLDVDLRTQVEAWNKWNLSRREKLADVSVDQRTVVLDWLRSFNRRDLNILEVGCGAGWLVPSLTEFGHVTATDLADERVAQAARENPGVTFAAGDFLELNLGGDYDVIVTLEVLSSLRSQAAFIDKIADMLKPGGHLMLAMPNKPMLLRNDIPEYIPGQVRHWLDRSELLLLLKKRFSVMNMFTITPQFNRGLLRIPNSYKLKATLNALGLNVVTRFIKRTQERMGLGWTVMALARSIHESTVVLDI